MGAGTVSEQKARDANALAVVLLQALTGRRTLQGSATLLPTPFDGIIRNGLSGKWGLAEMTAALGPVTPTQVVAANPRTADGEQTRDCTRRYCQSRSKARDGRRKGSQDTRGRESRCRKTRTPPGA